MTDCDVFETPPGAFGSPFLIEPGTGRRILLVTPRGDERLIAGKVHQTYNLDQAVDRLGAGMTLRLLPGKYYRSVELVGKRGTADAAIEIEGWPADDEEKRTHICGTNAAGAIYPDQPTEDDYALFKLRNCSHVTIRNLRVESCWPSFVYAENSHHIALTHIDAQDGSYLVFMRGPKAQDLTVAHCRWDQDPTGTLWGDIDWEHSHHGPYAYYNGALAGGVDVRGNIEVAHCTVVNAHNGVRFDTSTDDKDRILGRFNVNAQIHHNRFVNLRDNAVEPEQTCLNWHIHDNEMKNVHAVYSIHHLHGGFIFIYGNRLWFDDRGGADYQENRGGKIYKFHRKGPMPRHPIHVFHNSLYSRTFLIKKARTRLFSHRSNAVQFCDPAAHKQCLCRDDREFLKKFPIDEDGNPVVWDDTVVFDNDATNKPFGALSTEHGQEKDGLVLDDLGFADPMKGDFTLRGDSPLRNAAVAFTLKPGEDHPGGEPWLNLDSAGGRLHIGAVQEKGNELELPFASMPIETGT